MNRRRFLGGAGVVGLGALAGCTNALGSVAPPQVPDEQLNDGGWEQTDRTEETVLDESYGPVNVTAKSTTLTFSDEALAQEVANKTLGRIDGTLAIFAASHINFDPNLNNLPGGVGRKEVISETETQARAQFEQQMRDQGLENVERVGEEEFTTDSGKSPGLATYRGEFPVGTIEFDANGETFALDVGTIEVAGDLAVWNEGDFVVVAGGAYPAESYAETVDNDLSNAINVTVDVDLGLTPDQYREEVRSLMAATR
jgi:hypothetical protein